MLIKSLKLGSVLILVSFLNILDVKSYNFRITHNWWHVALCYLEGHSIQKVQEIYFQRIWKELEKPNAIHPEVYHFNFRV